METRKLYYEDCHTRTFEACVITCEQTGKGCAVTLDATAFYPEGGGQACDLGILGDAKVLDVREQGTQIVHLCDRPLVPGEMVTGQVDWQRRFDLMQQHTGEHIVSGIVHRRFGYHNVGFHMGSDMVTIDFDGMIPAEVLEEIEREANQTVWANLPVRCWYPDKEQLPRITYRSKRALPWPVRIVEVPDTDSCACCGVHVKQTGEVGLVKLFSCVKFHQGVRIEMACGGRALAYLSRVYEQNRQVSQAFSAKVLETGAAARKINETLAAEKYRVVALQKQIFAQIAGKYSGRTDVLHFEPELTPAGVRELAEAIAGTCTGVAAVFSGTEDRYDVCLARPGGDVKQLGAEMTEHLNGRGGGKPGFFQGNVRSGEREIREFFASRFS